MGMSFPFQPVPVFGLKLGVVWDIGMGNGNQESLFPFLFLMESII